MQILGYIGYAILFFFAITWVLGIRVKLRVGLHTIMGSLFYTVSVILLGVLEINKLHSWWVLPSGFIFVFLCSLILASRVPILYSLIKILGSLYAGIIRIGIPKEKIRIAQYADAMETIERVFSNRDRSRKIHKDEENNNLYFLYDKLWREGLSEIVPENRAKEIATELLIPDKIDSWAFANNYASFLRRGVHSFRSLMFPDEIKNPCTPSIMEASSPLNYIPSFPDWFIAAYPDVFLWFGHIQHERTRNRKEDEDIEDVMAALICEVFGINPEDKDLRKDDVYDSDGKWLPKWLKNLVSSYKLETGKKPETSVDETNNNEIKEIYENVDVFAEMAESGIDTFTIIARKTTMYYLELSNHYKNRFESETYLLAAAGVFDAQVYIFLNKNIEISEIVELAEEAITIENDPLTEFIVGLETKIFTVDSPELTQEVIESSCQEERPRINEEIQRVRSEYKRDAFIAKEVHAFMESPNFSDMREQLYMR